MAAASFALALLLYLGLDLPEAAPAASYAARPESVVEITYGSVIKLMHERTKFRLHSHDVPYGSGSGQQSVTSFPNVDDANSYWIVRPQPDSSAKQGGPIAHGTIVRLQHMRTRKWLHSHLHASPITGNLELLAALVVIVSQIQEITGGSRLRAVRKLGGKIREFGCAMSILVAISTAMIGSIPALLVGSKRYVELVTSALTTSGWQLKVFIFR
ncbi:hypothetical protein ACP70R_046034 [Stipagrostis hirtigluma subsp. patula]